MENHLLIGSDDYLIFFTVEINKLERDIEVSDECTFYVLIEFREN